MYKAANVIAKTVAATMMVAVIGAFFVLGASSPCNNMDKLDKVERPMLMNGKMVNMGGDR